MSWELREINIRLNYLAKLRSILFAIKSIACLLKILYLLRKTATVQSIYKETIFCSTDLVVLVALTD